MTKQELQQLQELAALAEEANKMWHGPVTSQDQADHALVQQEMGYSSTLNELNLFDTSLSYSVFVFNIVDTSSSLCMY